MKIRSFIAFPILFVSVVYSTQAQTFTPDKEIVKALKNIKPSDIKEHIQYLADDKLLGRKPGTPGYQMAVDYVIAQLKGMKIQPAGEKGTYVQAVKLRKAKSEKATSTFGLTMSGQTEEMTWGKDFVIYPNFASVQTEVSAPLVFAGYGISAPELDYDDYEGIDAKGKIVIVLRGAPERFASSVASHSQNTYTILETAYHHGAVGVLLASLSPRPLSNTESMSLDAAVGHDGKIYSRNYFDPAIKLTGTISASLFNTLCKNSGVDLGDVLPALKSGKPKSSDLNATVQVSYTSEFKEIESYNVIGKIEGSDPELKSQYVIHSAHLDHVGVGTPIKGDSIYNGAHDNASGVASLLEIAKLYSGLSTKPKRSILFVFVTAEEMGLLGSNYFAHNPTVPKEMIVADINTDMPTVIAPLLAAVPLGAEHSSLKNQVAEACRYLNIDMEEDPEPEQVRFIRSDQYSFVLAGIPALHIKYGNKSLPNVNLDEKVKAWRSTYYHKPQDEPNGIFDFEAAKTYVQLNFLISYQVAQNISRPTWNENDFFGQRYGMK